ncbi:hypothetical protein FVER53590_00134 [Fusarium verticillioides]|nr:hypothetical protein FVER53590_00134 [Fusarium verticillioides]
MGGHKSRTNVETFNDPRDNEMEWEMTHRPNPTSQTINQLRLELRTELDRGLDSVINRIDAGHQKFLQTTTDYIEQTIRRTIEEYMVNSQDDAQSLPSHRASPEPSNYQMLLKSAEADYKTQIEDLTAMLEKTKSELKNIKSQLKASESRADQLRSIIVPHNEEAILDSEIQRIFSEVRALTQWVAERLFSNTGKYGQPTTPDSTAFFEDMHGIRPERRQDAVHAHLSTLIRRLFFPTSIGEFDIGGKYAELQELVAVTERKMRDTITANHPKGAASNEMVNWTRATFKCLDLLVDKSNETDSYAVFLEQFFKPVETDDIRSQNIGRKKLKTLCKKANELGILLRRSENIFQIFTVTNGISFSISCDKFGEVGESDRTLNTSAYNA